MVSPVTKWLTKRAINEASTNCVGQVVRSMVIEWSCEEHKAEAKKQR